MKIPEEVKMATLAAAGAADLNDDLVWIMNALEETLGHIPAGHPARRSLFEARQAAERSAETLALLLEQTKIYGGLAGPGGLEAAIEYIHDPRSS